jgi:hypothetical protein
MQERSRGCVYTLHYTKCFSEDWLRRPGLRLLGALWSKASAPAPRSTAVDIDDSPFSRRKGSVLETAVAVF